MREVYGEINQTLVKLTNAVTRYEKQAILQGEFQDITCNDIHIIEAVGLEGSKNMSMIAKSLSVTVGSLTTAMNGLVRKGYVERERSQEDRRVVYIRLSDSGRRVFKASQLFHRNVLDLVCKDLTPEQKNMIRELLMTAQDRLLELDPADLLKE